MIPVGSNYPVSLDTDNNLFVVHDSLRLQLAEDYNPGDTQISVITSSLISNFPPTGIITLTEQCSDIENRAISLYYSSHDTNNFYGLELLPEFTDSLKPAIITDVTLNVISLHHNNLKDALIAIEGFLGTKGTTDLTPFGDTIEGRLNYLKNIVYTPRAWFSADQTFGVAPLDVEFTQQCFRLGTKDVTLLWDFGDQTISNISNISVISTTSVVPVGDINVIVYDDFSGPIKKTYTNPGIYSVTLTATNDYGQDIVTFENMINVRTSAPNEAQINIIAGANQLASAGDSPPIYSWTASDPGGAWTIPPTIRSTINTFIQLEIPPGNLNPNFSYAGEPLNGSGNPIDPINSFTWMLSDDLKHPSSRNAIASYSVGGIYDIILRCDTTFGSYRITEYFNCINIIEQTNLWLFNFNIGGFAVANEYGLISETFKTANTTLSVPSDNTFLNGTGNEAQAKQEFSRNTGFIKQSGINSGNRGSAILAWASGGSPLSSQTVNTTSYEGFSDTYSSTGLSITRPWNWVLLSSPSTSYFLFGPYTTNIPNENYSDQDLTTLDLHSLTTSDTTLTSANYLNGANELQEFPTSSYTAGEPNSGRFAVYRTAWQNNNGYILRNSNVGTFFKISSFYSTVGTISQPLVNLTKVPDMPGIPKTEGQLVSLYSGVFFFNNSGSISFFDTTAQTWSVGGASSSSATFQSVQDSSVANFDDTSNTLLAASDGSQLAFLSYDYSSNAFIKFNAADLTFTNQGSRPIGNQWMLNIY